MGDKTECKATILPGSALLLLTLASLGSFGSVFCSRDLPDCGTVRVDADTASSRRGLACKAHAKDKTCSNTGALFSSSN
jgi:hypothetical protein